MTSLYNFFFPKTTCEEYEGILIYENVTYDNTTLEIEAYERYSDTFSYTLKFMVRGGYIDLPIEKNINFTFNVENSSFYFYDKKYIFQTSKNNFDIIRFKLLKVFYETFYKKKFDGNYEEFSKIFDVELPRNNNFESFLEGSIAVDYNKHHLFVAEDKEISIYSLDDKLTFATSISPFGENFDIKKILLNGQRELFSLDCNNAHNVSSVNLDRNDVVENYDTGEYVVNDICNIFKHPAGGYEFLGINKNGIMTFDTRVKDPLIKNKSLFYNADSKSLISCIATSGCSDVYVGTQKGIIKMYKRKNIEKDRTDVDKSPRATLSIPVTKSAITSLDVSFDGNRIVATTNEKIYYIVVSPFEKDYEIFEMDISDGDSKKYSVVDDIYISAKFDNTFNKLVEEKIVVSRGNIMIEWDLKPFTPTKYKIIKMGNTVVDKGYTLADDRIVYATIDNFGVLE